MESITKRLKENILIGFEEERVYNRQDIKDFLNTDYKMVFGADYQESHLAGALASLVKKGKLVLCERGKYKCVMQNKQMNLDQCMEPAGDSVNAPEIEKTKEIEQIKKNVNESVNRECNYLKEITSEMKISLASLEKKDINNVLLIKELIEYLENFRFL